MCGAAPLGATAHGTLYRLPMGMGDCPTGQERIGAACHTESGWHGSDGNDVTSAYAAVPRRPRPP
ncbi:hypothetical protein SSCG_03648 [Streptomyces clavuligerus]|nr:hypothetical protein SSCG_03648 [Streptomyces clavuligerus]